MSLFSVFVNKDWDISFGMLTHNVLAPPAIPTPAPMFSIEMVATQKWPPGFVMNQNKLTTTVKHVGQGIVQNGHDCGMLVLDVTPPVMPNLWYAICWPFSSRKITFAAATVKMDGQPVGCAQLGPMPLPMMTCGDPISAPTAFLMINCFTSQVRVGMSLADFLMGLLNIALSIAIDFLFEMVGGKKAGEVVQGYGRRAFSREAMEQVARTATESVGAQLARGMLGKLGFEPQEALKRGVSAAAGLLTSSLEGNPTFKYSIGAPWSGFEGSIDAEGPVLQSNALGAQADTRGQSALWGESL